MRIRCVQLLIGAKRSVANSGSAELTKKGAAALRAAKKGEPYRKILHTVRVFLFFFSSFRFDRIINNPNVVRVLFFYFVLLIRQIFSGSALFRAISRENLRTAASERFPVPWKNGGCSKKSYVQYLPFFGSSEGEGGKGRRTGADRANTVVVVVTESD